MGNRMIKTIKRDCVRCGKSVLFKNIISSYDLANFCSKKCTKSFYDKYSELLKSPPIECTHCGKTTEKTLTIQEKIDADVDDEIYAMKKRTQKKYKLTWAQARDEVNYALRLHMIAFPEHWLKR